MTMLLNNIKRTNNIWVISDSSPVSDDLSAVCKEPVSGPVLEYKISELGRYLLDPKQIALEERVVGCKILRRKPASGKVNKFFSALFKSKQKSADSDSSSAEDIISNSRIGAPAFLDMALNAHFIKLREILKPYDPVQKKIAGLEEENIEDIKAICEDIGKSRHRLNLQGTIKEKISFVANSLSKKVKVTFNRAYLMNGLFEMRGFDFSLYDHRNSYRLIKFVRNDKVQYMLLNKDNKLEFEIEDSVLIHYLHLFEQSIRTDTKLRDAFELCMRREAGPLKLFFSTQREKNYSENQLPMVYRKAMHAFKISPDIKEVITEVLNRHQSIVTFNYVPCSGVGKNKLYTNISVMHDIKALEPIKSTMPELYSEIDKKTYTSDVGRLYLLESLRGYQNV